MKFTIGTDIELALTDGERLVSAIPFIPGDKHNPQPMKCGSLLQHDNVMVEFAIPYTDSEGDLVKKIHTALKNTKSQIPKHLSMLAIPSGYYDPEELNNEEAQKFGCDPDFNAWLVCQNDTPCADSANFRTCGGHIHIGSRVLASDENKFRLVKMMDCFHSLTMMTIDRTIESIERKMLYGKAGCHRPKPYPGIEYRALSNTWISEENLVRLMFRLSRDAMNILVSGKDEDIIEAIGRKRITSTIDEGDIDTARELVGEYVLPNVASDTREAIDIALSCDINFNVEKTWRIAA